MISDRELDDALASGRWRSGWYNTRPVHCARCGQPCLPSQARKVFLGGRWFRGVMLCLTRCFPKGGDGGVSRER